MISPNIQAHLTEMEKDVIIGIANNEFSNEPGDWVWSYSVHYNLKITSQTQLPGVISSLIKKGLVMHDHTGEQWGDCVALTKDGVEAFKRLIDDSKNDA